MLLYSTFLIFNLVNYCESNFKKRQDQQNFFKINIVYKVYNEMQVTRNLPLKISFLYRIKILFKEKQQLCSL